MAWWMSLLLAGASLCAFSWVLLQPGRQAWRSMRQPRGVWRWLHWVWPWVDAMAQLCRPFLVWRWRSALAQRLKGAGLTTPWSPEHWVAMQLWLMGLATTASGTLVWQAGWASAAGAGVAAASMLLAGLWPFLWLGRRRRERQRVLQRELPFFLDLLTLCVEAGLGLQGALQQAVGHSAEGALKQELAHVLAQLRTGVPRADAFETLAERTGLSALQQFALTLRQAEQFGMSLGPILRAQATQQREERFLRAEKLALEAPVKMLFPLVCCIFPCTFLIIGFPLVASFLRLS